MLDCWHENPDLRPTFERLYQVTTELLEVEVRLRKIMKPVLAYIQVDYI